MKSVINYRLSNCTKCLKCLRVCPSEAISIKDYRVNIDDTKCTNCGLCIDVCSMQGLQALGGTLNDLNNYDYKIALLPSAIYGCCKNAYEAKELVEAVCELGFNEVFDTSIAEGMIVELIEHECHSRNEKGCISSFCPVVNNIILTKYPMLKDKLVNIDYPQEIAAKILRKKYRNQKKLGIFYFAECISKLSLAKYPFDNKLSSIDHAISLTAVFPSINRNRKIQNKKQVISKKGLESSSMNLQLSKSLHVLEIDGLDKCKKVLELAEFSQMNQFDYISCSFCNYGCIGGNLIWGNPFDAKFNVGFLLDDCENLQCSLDQIDTTSNINCNDQQHISIKDKLYKFNQINNILEGLPQFDCGACGYASCRAMAEQIVLNKKEIKDCQIFKAKGVKK